MCQFRVALSVCCSILFSASVFADSVRVRLEPTSSETRISAETLSRIGGDLIREYEAFSVIRAPLSAVQEIIERAAEARVHAQPMPEWDVILVPNGRIDRATRASHQRVVATGPGLFVVHFAAPLTADDFKLLKAAELQYVGYLPHNAVLVFGSPASLEPLAAQPHVEWVGMYDPAFRQQPEFVRGEAVAAYRIQIFNGPRSEELVERILSRNRSSDAVQFTHGGGRFTRLEVELAETYARELLQSPYVVGIEERGVDLLSGERSSLGMTGQTASYRAWLQSRSSGDNTSSYRIAVADTGLGGGQGSIMHRDFDQPGKVAAWITYDQSNGNDPDGHGTAVAGMAAGDPQVSDSVSRDPQGYWRGLGTAYRTPLIVQKIVNDDLNFIGNQVTWLNDAKAAGATVQTLSRNNHHLDTGVYQQDDALFDEAVRKHDLPVTISTGNIYPLGEYFSTSPVVTPALAKNVITIGGTETVWPEAPTVCVAASQTPAQWVNNPNKSYSNVAFFSRRGTSEGRIKPDLVAPASVITSAKTPGRTWCGETPEHIISSGTSFASPHAAAAVVLLNSRRGNSPAVPMGAAMAKAALIGTAASIRGGEDRWTEYCGATTCTPAARTIKSRPDAETGQGWGRVNLEAITSAATSERFLEGKSTSTGFLAPFTDSGQRRDASFSIGDSSKPVTVVLVWSDEPALAGIQNPLVNDLDLRVSVDCSDQYRGNLFDANEFSENTCGFGFPQDGINTVEMIHLPAGVGTTFTVSVISRNWADGAIDFPNQPFSVYVRNAY